MARIASRVPRTQPPMTLGHLVMWNDAKGFGFIRPLDSEDDYFVHISTFKKGLPRRPTVGDEVHFRPHVGGGRKRAQFALIPSLETEAAKSGTPFVLNPRPRTPLTNALIAAPLILSGYLLVMAQNPLPFFAYGTLSILTMFLYGKDKANSAIRGWRVPELYFHLLEFLGGWPGALMAQNDFRHKTRVTTYLWILRGIIAIHLMVWFIYFYWTWRLVGSALN